MGHNLPPLVEIGLSDLAKPERAIAHLAHPSPTSLLGYQDLIWSHSVLNTLLLSVPFFARV